MVEEDNAKIDLKRATSRSCETCAELGFLGVFYPTVHQSDPFGSISQTWLLFCGFCFDPAISKGTALSEQETFEQECIWMVQSWQMMLLKLQKH